MTLLNEQAFRAVKQPVHAGHCFVRLLSKRILVPGTQRMAATYTLD